MREIKFRAWKESTSEMISWYGLLNDYSDTLSDVLSGIYLASVMQYTGLKDKNGVEIYESDLLKFDPEEYGSEDSTFIVEWDDKDGCWSGLGVFHEWSTYCEVVGNIYETGS